MSARVRIALIGCGFQGRLHGRNLASSESADLAMCCDRVPSRARELAVEVGADGFSDDSQSVIEDPSIDAVVIATTTSNHAELSIAAATAGKHVLLEKPMAVSVEDCLRIERAVAAAGVTLMIGFKFRFAPAVVAARNAVPDPIVVTAHTMYDASQTTAGWLNDRSLSGGRLMSSLVHSVDLLCHLADSVPTRVFAEGGNLAIDGLGEPDNAVATLQFENGVIGSIVHGSSGVSPLVSTWSFQTAGVGCNATIFDHGRRMRLHTSEQTPDPPEFVDTVEDPFDVGMKPMVEEFISSIRDGVSPPPGPREGVLSVLVSRAIERAIASGQPQQVSQVS